jgi:hypothetical protein
MRAQLRSVPFQVSAPGLLKYRQTAEQAALEATAVSAVSLITERPAAEATADWDKSAATAALSI